MVVSLRKRWARMRLRPTTAAGRSSQPGHAKDRPKASWTVPTQTCRIQARSSPSGSVGLSKCPSPCADLQQFTPSLIQHVEAQAPGGEGFAPRLTVVSVAVEIVVLEPHHTRRVSDDAPNFPIMSSPCVPTPSNGASPFSRGCSVPRSLGRCDCGERRDQSDRWGRGCRLYKDLSRRVGDEER